MNFSDNQTQQIKICGLVFLQIFQFLRQKKVLNEHGLHFFVTMDVVLSVALKQNCYKNQKLGFLRYVMLNGLQNIYQYTFSTHLLQQTVILQKC